MANEARKWTEKLLTAVEDGMLDPNVVVGMCLNYLAESEVADMLRLNDLKEYVDQCTTKRSQRIR